MVFATMSSPSTGSCSENQINSLCVLPGVIDERCTSFVMTETETTALKEVLCAQQQLLQKLYSELDEEREASATAASEALSMIIRLQGEKAAVKMEANQYKRMTEEKIFHAEESLAVFEDLMYQKEMQIAALEFQIRAYRCKLLSMGCSDLVTGGTTFSESLLLQRDDAFGGDDIMRRSNSNSPAIRLDDSYCNATERKMSESDLIPKKLEYDMDAESIAQSLDKERTLENYAVENFTSYWDQIRKLDEVVRDILDNKDSGGGDKQMKLNRGLWPDSLYSEVPTTEGVHVPIKLDLVKCCGNLLESEEIENSSCSSSVQDIFEVPQTSQDHRRQQKKEVSKLNVEGENSLGKLDPTLREAIEFNLKHETEWTKNVFLQANHENKLSKPSDEITVDHHSVLVCPAIGVPEFQEEFQKLSRRMEQLEIDRKVMCKEANYGAEEEVKLLKEIHEQLNSIETEIRSWRQKELLPSERNSVQSETRNLTSKKPLPTDESSLVSVMEAMLHFWL